MSCSECNIHSFLYAWAVTNITVTVHNICIEWAIKSIPVEPVWTRGTETLFDSHVQLQTFVLVKLTNGTGSGDPEQILSYPATCSGCCRTSTMQRSFLCICYFWFYNLCIFMLPAPFNSGAVCFWSTPTDKTSAIHHGLQPCMSLYPTW